MGAVSLFRREVVDAQQQAWLGRAQVTRPLPLSVATAFVAAMALAVGAFLFAGHYTRKAHVPGVLAPDRGLIRLVAPQPATVAEVHAREGASVRRGDVLFVLSVGADTARGDAQGAVQASLAARERSLREASRRRAQLQGAQAAALDRRLADLRAELAQLDAEARLHDERLALARQSFARWQALQRDGFIAAAQLQAKSDELLGLEAGRQALARQRAALLGQAGAVEAERRELPLRAEAEQGEIERSLHGLAQESAESLARQRIVVRAPQDGTLANVLAEVGQPATPSSALAGLVPAEARLEAHLYAPSSAVGFVHAGQSVLLRLQAYPYQKFGAQPGRVTQVSRVPLRADELASLPLPALAGANDDGGGAAEPLYRITVALDRQAISAYGGEQPLAAGMQLDADVLLDRRRLVEWLFEPVLGLAGRV